MDWTAVFSVYGVLLITGVIISLLSTQLQCSKISFASALKEGALFGLTPTIGYIALNYFDVVREPFITFFKGFGLDDASANMFGIGFIVMLIAWPSSVWNVHNSEIDTCVASASEMTEFKEKLMKELAEKQQQEEKNSTASKIKI